MPVKQFHHMNLRICRSQMDAVKEFYVDVLGLSVGHRPPFRSSGYWLYAGDSAVVHLFESDIASTPAANDTGAIDHLAFHCSGYEEMRSRVEKAGVIFDTARVPETGQRQLFFPDPAGIRIELLFDD